jgi:hypothetical protein
LRCLVLPEGSSNGTDSEGSKTKKAAKEAVQRVPAAKVPRAKNAYMIFAAAKRGEIKGEQAIASAAARAASAADTADRAELLQCFRHEELKKSLLMAG